MADTSRVKPKPVYTHDPWWTKEIVWENAKHICTVTKLFNLIWITTIFIFVNWPLPFNDTMRYPVYKAFVGSDQLLCTGCPRMISRIPKWWRHKKTFFFAFFWILFIDQIWWESVLGGLRYDRINTQLVQLKSA